jgi:hypothetical protein
MAHFGPDAACFVVGYRDAPGEVRRITDGSLLKTLSGMVHWVHFDADASTFVVGYRDAPGELRRTADGSLLKTLSGEVSWVRFSPDEDATSLIVDYQDVPDEVRRTADGSLLEVLPDEVEDVRLSADADATDFIVGYKDAPDQVRCTTNGSLLATLSGEVVWVDFADATTFVVRYRDGRSELWEGRGNPRLLAELELGVGRQFVDPKSQRLVLWYSDGRTYLLDLDWLRAIGGDPAALSPEALVRLACEGPLATGLFDQATLELHLEGSSPQACR